MSRGARTPGREVGMPTWIQIINDIWPVFGPLLLAVLVIAVAREIAGLLEERP